MPRPAATLDRRTRCQLADQIEETIGREALRGRTQPWVWLGQLFGPLIERVIPIRRTTRQERRASAYFLLLMFPLLVISALLALPSELLRELKVRRHNTELDHLLATLRSGTVPEALAAADRLVVADYRIEHEGRALFCGSALFTLRGDRGALVASSVHRGRPPREADDGEAIDRALAGGAEVAFWVWPTRDAYELVERNERPW